MTLQQLVITSYREIIAKRVDLPEDLRKALLTLDRTQHFLQNVMKEVKESDRRNQRATKEEVLLWVEGITNVYLNTLKQHMDESHLSILEKLRRQDEAKALKEAADLAEAFAQDDDEEIETNGAYETNRSSVKIT